LLVFLRYSPYSCSQIDLFLRTSYLLFWLQALSLLVTRTRGNKDIDASRPPLQCFFIALKMEKGK